MAHRKVDVDDIIGDEDGWIEDENTIPFETLERAGLERVELGKQQLSRGTTLKGIFTYCFRYQEQQID